jgi:hypothetical protein
VLYAVAREVALPGPAVKIEPTHPVRADDREVKTNQAVIVDRISASVLDPMRFVTGGTGGLLFNNMLPVLGEAVILHNTFFNVMAEVAEGV